MDEKIKRFVTKHGGLLLSVLLTVFAMLPLFQPGFFPIHDDEQVGRLYELDQALKQGHIPPRIAQNLGFGYGYPLFNFYPSFVYYVAEVFVLLGFSFIVSIKLMIAAGFILAAIFMYLFSKRFFGTAGGIVAAVAYTYAPYHAVDIYVRGALPEFWSFVFIPALFWSLTELKENGRKRDVVFTALFFAALILTHNLVALMSGIFLGLYGLYLLVNATKKQKFLLQSLFSVLIGLLLSAYFWIPSFFEKKYTMIELLTTELADYRQHFVYLRQLWDSPWGYGGSLYGLYDGLSFQIGKLHIIGSVLAIVVLLYLWKKNKKVVLPVSIFIILFSVSVFMTSFYSQFLWDSLQPLSYIQFPWRFLLFAAFTSSFLTGALFLLRFSKKIKIVTALLLSGLIILAYGKFFQPSKYLPQVTDTDYISQDVLRWRTSSMAFEYVPKGIATRKSPVGNTIIDIEQNEIASTSHQIVTGEMRVKTITDKPHEKELFIETYEGGILRLNTYAFPGWQVTLNGKKVNYSDSNKFKLITVIIPSGEHRLTAVFTDTFYRTLGNSLTLLGILMLMLFSLMPIKLKRKKS